MRFFRLSVLFIFLVSSVCCAQTRVRQYGVSVVAEYPHDVKAYTQGLFFHDGFLYESTGQYGASSFRKVDLATGKVLRRLDFDDRYFVEGSAVLGDELYILTWTNKVAFIYDAGTLEYKSAYSYPREGWGLTADGRKLYATDGSACLYVMDGRFKVEKRLTVKMNGRPVRFLNELEYIDGRIWANVYTSDLIVIINPESGVVEGTVDCTGLLPSKLRTPSADVLNGIAYNPADGKIYLTGKNWPRLYEIRLVEKK